MTIGTKKIVGIDVDGVVADFVNPLISIYNEKHKEQPDIFHIENLTAQHINCFDITNVIGKKQFQACFEQFESVHMCENLQPIDGAISCINKLQEKHRIVFVTTPSWSYKTWQVERLNWLLKHFTWFNNSNLVSLNDKSLFRGDLLIDDAVHNISNWMQSTGLPAIQFKQPWNESFTQCPNVISKWDDDAIAMIELCLQNK